MNNSRKSSEGENRLTMTMLNVLLHSGSASSKKAKKPNSNTISHVHTASAPFTRGEDNIQTHRDMQMYLTTYTWCSDSQELHVSLSGPGLNKLNKELLER